MTDTVTDTDPRVVILTTPNGEADYLSAAVYPDQESADERVSELRATAPWYTYSTVPASKHFAPVSTTPEG